MAKPVRTTAAPVAGALVELQIQPLPPATARARARRLLAKHHYLGDVRAVGEQLFYAVTTGRGDWLGVLVCCAAARRWRARDQGIGWREEQRRRRLPLVVNDCPFLLLPHKTFPNLGSRAANSRGLSATNSVAAQNVSQSRLARPAPHAGPAVRRLAGAVRPSRGAGRDVRRSRAVLRHRLYRQRLGGAGHDRRLWPRAPGLLCAA